MFDDNYDTICIKREVSVENLDIERYIEGVPSNVSDSLNEYFNICDKNANAAINAILEKNFSDKINYVNDLVKTHNELNLELQKSLSNKQPFEFKIGGDIKECYNATLEMWGKSNPSKMQAIKSFMSKLEEEKYHPKIALIPECKEPIWGIDCGYDFVTLIIRCDF